jgi:tetratricopeptide (TPR) repeat protein
MDRIHSLRSAAWLPLLALVLGLGACAKPGAQQAEDVAAPAPVRPATRGTKAEIEAQKVEMQRRARVHYQMGVEHLRANRSPQAVSALLEARRFDPDSERTELALAEAYRQQGRSREAEAHLLRALQIDPRFHQAAFNLSALYIQTERYEEAIPHLQQLLADPTFAGPWRALSNLGWAEYRLGRYDDAHRHLTLAVDHRPDHWPARLNLGILEAERGNRDTAIEQFQHVLQDDPGPLAEAEVRFRLAEQLMSAGDKQGAVRQLKTASNLEPSGPWSRRSAEYLQTLQ